ncbi:FUT7 [Bugula neritina]|uniref:Fucosyltransferase n=1 Tax=Bugula neritina TaxID=10212 RepID=A0A7J7J518_BUGNE|nr:FUT7 [Bugula neritina]
MWRHFFESTEHYQRINDMIDLDSRPQTLASSSGNENNIPTAKSDADNIMSQVSDRRILGDTQEVRNIEMINLLIDEWRKMPKKLKCGALHSVFLVTRLPKIIPLKPSGQLWALQTGESQSRIEIDLAKWNGYFDYSFTFKQDSDWRYRWASSLELHNDANATEWQDVSQVVKALWFVSNCNEEGEYEVTNYITEKFWKILEGRHLVIPIVMGGLRMEEYENIAPPNSYIHVRNFTSPKHLAEHLRYVNLLSKLWFRRDALVVSWKSQASHSSLSISFSLSPTITTLFVLLANSALETASADDSEGGLSDKWGDNQAVLLCTLGNYLTNCAVHADNSVQKVKNIHSPLTAFILSALKYGDKKLVI